MPKHSFVQMGMFVKLVHVNSLFNIAKFTTALLAF